MSFRVVNGGIAAEKNRLGSDTVSYEPKTGFVISVNDAWRDVKKVGARMEFEPTKGDDGKWVYKAYLVYKDGSRADVVQNRNVQAKILHSPLTLYKFVVRNNPEVTEVVIPVLPEDDG